jgi:chromosome segregation ATPase
MTISVISSTLASSYSTLLGPRTVQNNGAAQADDKTAQAGADAGSTAGGSQGKPANFKANGASASQASGDSGSSDPVSQTIKQLEQQLRQVMQQIQRLQASSIPAEQKAPQLQALNSEAAALQSQIASLLQQQAEAAKGGVTA